MAVTSKVQLGFAAVLLAGTGAAAGVMLSDRAPQAAAVPTMVAGPAFAPLAGAPASLADMVEAVGPSVVQIQVKPDAGPMQRMAYGDEGAMPGFGGQLPDELQDRLRDLFGDALRGRGGPDQGPQQGPQGGPQQGGALGSGFIVDASGLVVTNNHVVGNATNVTVQLSDGREFKGVVLGRDPQTDIAVVRINAQGTAFKAIAWGDSDRTRVGDSVFAVGSPFGLGNTVTSGIVSARGREIGAGPYDDFLQVDAAINSGNSGGPLFDNRGRVVGVNTAIFSPSGGNVGIGFAIPAHMVQRVAQQIVANGHVARGKIGVALQAVTPDIARGMGLEETKGALVAQVDGAGSAARSGLRQGDVVRSFDGKPVDDSRDLARLVADAKAGSKVPVAVIRDGKRVSIDLAIGGESA
nr:trypsin-like peptidase domain-containing protein [Polymorphobacter sp.]